MYIRVWLSKFEFADMIRKCDRARDDHGCIGCVLRDMCKERGDQASFEHVVHISLEDDCDGATYG